MPTVLSARLRACAAAATAAVLSAACTEQPPPTAPAPFTEDVRKEPKR